jgi:hypothetical protein
MGPGIGIRAFAGTGCRDTGPGGLITGFGFTGITSGADFFRVDRRALRNFRSHFRRLAGSLSLSSWLPGYQIGFLFSCFPDSVHLPGFLVSRSNSFFPAFLIPVRSSDLPGFQIEFLFSCFPDSPPIFLASRSNSFSCFPGGIAQTRSTTRLVIALPRLPQCFGSCGAVCAWHVYQK